MSYKLVGELDIVIEECVECGVKFGMTEILHQWKKENKKTFYCPNGHGMSYTKSELDRLRGIISEKDKSLAYFRQIEQERFDKIKADIAAKKQSAKPQRKNKLNRHSPHSGRKE
jgi:hypothetical protein